MSGPKSTSDAEAGLDDFMSYEDERIAHLVRLCARGFNRSLARRLAQHGITFGQWVLLRILWNREGLSQRDLSALANLTEPTTHKVLIKLEKQGIVKRKILAPNRRQQLTFLTERGRELQDVLQPLVIEANEAALKGIPEARRSQLRSDLISILANLAADEAEAEAHGIKIPATRSYNQ
ncbi:MAG: MarR family winged helix-turn-helix transcriptional regulator [Magnetospiraceae bacterium]